MWQKITQKIKSIEEAAALVEAWRSSGEKIVWTNGCFDLLHLGHIKYLCQARGLGNRLIVGVNSDASVKRLKGPQRPILDQESRLTKIAALEAVDMVVPFEENTPIVPICRLRPDVLVKGGDYKPEEVVGAAEIKEWNGVIFIIDFEAGHSTTEILRKIKTLRDVD
ncbi:MAG: D-glycero-beta-D-manno-heptose 1-phosphate adenylyltransferase [Saprospiraceae bacterium]|nr:D-glycero-beta-D-manno-heptose 1-phosphate adenylyltransferase [Saprospiraceae bacterium]